MRKIATPRVPFNRKAPPENALGRRGTRETPVSGIDPSPKAKNASYALRTKPRPSRIIPFTDVLVFWVINPIKGEEWERLKSKCNGRCRAETRRPRWGRKDRGEFSQKIFLRQPTREALELLLNRNDLMVTYLEIAQDEIFSSEDEKLDAFRFAMEHGLTKERRKQIAKVCLGKNAPTLYSGPRIAPNNLAVYTGKKSKPTKQPHCLHSEPRTSGPQALRRAGLDTIRKILEMDYEAFFAKRLQFYQITDFEGLGRAFLNMQAKQADPHHKSRRKPEIIRFGRYGYNVDKRMGHQLLRSCGLFDEETQITISRKAKEQDKRKYPAYHLVSTARSIQNLYDRFNKLIPLDRFMKKLELDVLGDQSANSAVGYQ